ncbi:MAG: multiprotein bridging factor aMBF1 [Candidatus Thermoplasmatota archaeon]|nr:multiprotein bridging factor aMBF1 [Candidatus Thermoplasmatota archaeon]
MATCEICGKTVNRTKKIKIDRVVLEVCDQCAVYGEPVEETAMPTSTAVRTQRIFSQKKPEKAIKEEYVLVDDYPDRVRKARQHLGLEQKDLAKMINEKQSVISKIESGGFQPDDATVKKLEKTLKISLREKM